MILQMVFIQKLCDFISHVFHVWYAVCVPTFGIIYMDHMGFDLLRLFRTMFWANGFGSMPIAIRRTADEILNHRLEVYSIIVEYCIHTHIYICLYSIPSP